MRVDNLALRFPMNDGGAATVADHIFAFASIICDFPDSQEGFILKRAIQAKDPCPVRNHRDYAAIPGRVRPGGRRISNQTFQPVHQQL